MDTPVVHWHNLVKQHTVWYGYNLERMLAVVADAPGQALRAGGLKVIGSVVSYSGLLS